jgi:hypothetical protein
MPNGDVPGVMRFSIINIFLIFINSFSARKEIFRLNHRSYLLLICSVDDSSS